MRRLRRSFAPMRFSLHELRRKFFAHQIEQAEDCLPVNRKINQIGFRQAVKGNLLGFHDINQLGEARRQGLSLLRRLRKFLRQAKLRIFAGPVINESHEGKFTADIADRIGQAHIGALRLKNIFIKIADGPDLAAAQAPACRLR